MENLKEQLNRIKLLYNYNLNETYEENKIKQSSKNYLNEAAAEALIAAKELGNAERAILHNSLETVVADIGAVTIKNEKGIFSSTKNVEEIVLAMKEGRIAGAELGNIGKSLLKSPATSTEIKSLAAELVTSFPSFEQKYGMLTREQAVNELMNGPGKYTKGEAETLMNKYKSRKSRVDPIEPPKTGEGPKPSEGPVNQNNINLNITNQVQSEGFKIAEEYGPHMDDAARKRKWKDSQDWLKNDERGFMEEYNRVSKGSRLRRGLNWGRKIMSWGTLWGIFKIAGIGLTLWAVYSLFTDSGWKVKDDDKIDDDDGGGGGGDDDGGGGGSPDDDQNQGVLIDVDGNKYIECTPPYYKGCVAKKGNDDIRKAQDCLGVTPNGFFNKETEDALYKKINKKSFSPSDMPSICATSYGASRFSY